MTLSDEVLKELRASVDTLKREVQLLLVERETAYDLFEGFADFMEPVARTFMSQIEGQEVEVEDDDKVKFLQAYAALTEVLARRYPT